MRTLLVCALYSIKYGSLEVTDNNKHSSLLQNGNNQSLIEQAHGCLLQQDQESDLLFSRNLNLTFKKLVLRHLTNLPFCRLNFYQL